MRGKQTVLRVFADGVETAAIALSAVRNKEGMHQIMRSHGFEMKSEQERKSDLDAANRLRQQRNSAMFHRKEYVRKQHLHAHLFREDVMKDTAYTQTSWVHKDHDFLHDNYDKIFRNEAITKEQLLEYAKRYLAKVGRL